MFPPADLSSGRGRADRSRHNFSINTCRVRRVLKPTRYASAITRMHLYFERVNFEIGRWTDLVPNRRVDTASSSVLFGALNTRQDRIRGIMASTLRDDGRINPEQNLFQWTVHKKCSRNIYGRTIIMSPVFYANKTRCGWTSCWLAANSPSPSVARILVWTLSNRSASRDFINCIHVKNTTYIFKPT